MVKIKSHFTNLVVYNSQHYKDTFLKLGNLEKPAKLDCESKIYF